MRDKGDRVYNNNPSLTQRVGMNSTRRLLPTVCLSRISSDAIGETSSVRHQSSRRTPPHSAQTLAAHQPTPPTGRPKNAFPPVTLPEESRGCPCPQHAFRRAITNTPTGCSRRFLKVLPAGQDFAACRDLGARICAKQPTSLNDASTMLALRQYENPCRQKEPTFTINRDYTHAVTRSCRLLRIVWKRLLIIA